jgi:hypothetical protein
MQKVHDAKTPIGEVLKAAEAGCVVVESESKARYAVLPLDDGLLDYLIEHHPKFVAECAEIRSRMQSGRSTSHDDVRRLFAKRFGSKGG